MAIHPTIQAERLRYRQRELAQQILFLQQAITAQRVRQELEQDAELRAALRLNATLKAIAAEQSEPDYTDDITVVPVGEPVAKTNAASSDADWYMRKYGERLDRAKLAVLVKERRRNGKPGRRAIVRSWLDLYRASGCAAKLRAIVDATKRFEKQRS